MDTISKQYEQYEQHDQHERYQARSRHQRHQTRYQRYQAGKYPLSGMQNGSSYGGGAPWES
ncbi:hypothetical protein OG604_23535 [Streptomyces sp. NBC_01231]|nr:hypothetical protein OG604_23535 [Streptomyces sp. NBC_01231]